MTEHWRGGVCVAFCGLEPSGARVQVAEDQPVNRLLLRKIFGKAGFTMTEAENGLEAVGKWLL